MYGPPEDAQADALLDRRLASLQFLDRRQLGLKPTAVPDHLADISLAIAEKALAQMHTLKPPGDKVQSIVNCCKIILSTWAGDTSASTSCADAGLRRRAGTGNGGVRGPDVLKQTDARGTEPGADDLVPMLVYVVLRARPRRLCSCLQYVQRFRTASKLNGEGGYYVATLVGRIGSRSCFGRRASSCGFSEGQPGVPGRPGRRRQLFGNCYRRIVCRRPSAVCTVCATRVQTTAQVCLF